MLHKMRVRGGLEIKISTRDELTHEQHCKTKEKVSQQVPSESNGKRTVVLIVECRPTKMKPRSINLREFESNY